MVGIDRDYFCHDRWNVHSASVTNTTSKTPAWTAMRAPWHVDTAWTAPTCPRTPHDYRIVIYSSTGSHVRLRARTSMAANNVPTAVNPPCPTPAAPASERVREERRLEHERITGRADFDRRQQEHADQLAHVDAGRSRAPSMSARNVSLCRSRSKARPPERPEKAMAFHSDAGGGIPTGRPSRRTRRRTPARTISRRTRRVQDWAADLDTGLERACGTRSRRPMITSPSAP